MNNISFNVFQVPDLAQGGVEKQTVIGIHDVSGSMAGVWSYLADSWNEMTKNITENLFTYTFSDHTIAVPSNILSRNTPDHNMSGTNIFSAFEMLAQLLSSNAIKTRLVSVIFVSDGEDNQPSTISQRLQNIQPLFKQNSQQYQISFLCVAVGSRFPTFLAMNMRSTLHSGDPNIPTIFLVDTSAALTEASFAEQFYILGAHINQEKQINVEPAIPQFVWSPEKTFTTLYSGQILVTDKKINQILCTLEDRVQVIHPLKEIYKDMVVKIGRSWLQMLQLDSVHNNVEQQAKQAILYLGELQEMIPQAQQNIKTKSVMQRIIKLQSEVGVNEIKEILNQLKSLSASELLSKLTPEEAAKRLAIGTKIGKYHKTALKFCGISVEDFLKIRNDAITIFRDSKIDFSQSDQQQSVISLQNMKDILQEPDLLPALTICPSQYDLIEVFPLIGQGLLIKRFDGALVNPWLIEVIDIARHHATVDSISIYQNPQQELLLQTGQGDQERINAVLPLFGEKDKDLQPHIRTRLFNILMTFNLLQNVDCCYDTSHAALSANTMIYLICQPASQWRDNFLQRIHFTFVSIYSDEPDFNAMKQTMLGPKPQLALVNEHPSLAHRCEDASKALIMLFDLMQSGQVPPNLKTLMDHLICEVIGRILPQDHTLLSLFAYPKIQWQESHQQALIDQVVCQLVDVKYVTSIELMTSITKKAKELNFTESDQIEVKLNQLDFLKGKYVIKNLQMIYKFFAGTTLEDSYFVCLVQHASQHRNSFKRNTTPIDTDLEQTVRHITKLAYEDVYKFKTIVDKCFELLKHNVVRNTTDDHFITPMSKSDLMLLIGDELLFKQLNYDTRSNMIRNGCQCITCPLYLTYSKCHRAHYNAYLPVRYSFYRLVKKMKNEDADSVLQLLQYGDVHPNITKFADNDPDKCLSLIIHLQVAYGLIGE